MTMEICKETKKELVNKGKKGKIKYQVYFNPLTDSYDSSIPICPFCNEPAYEDDFCVFCGAEFIKPTKEEMEYQRELNHEYEVSYKNIVAHQCGNSVWIYIDGKCYKHLTIFEPYSKEKLKELVNKEYEKYESKHKKKS